MDSHQVEGQQSFVLSVPATSSQSVLRTELVVPLPGLTNPLVLGENEKLIENSSTN